MIFSILYDPHFVVFNKNMTSDPRATLNTLINHRKDIEQQLDGLYQVLQSQRVSMEDPLVDAEGFPRADVDVYQVRTARRDIIRLRNDHKHVSEAIHQALIQVYSSNLAVEPFTPMPLPPSHQGTPSFY